MRSHRPIVILIPRLDECDDIVKCQNIERPKEKVDTFMTVVG